MSAIVTARLDSQLKERGTEVMKRLGHSPSEVIQALFEYAVKHDALPFEHEDKPTREEIIAKVALLDAIHVKSPISTDTKSLRLARLEEKHGPIS